MGDCMSKEMANVPLVESRNLSPYHEIKPEPMRDIPKIMEEIPVFPTSTPLLTNIETKTPKKKKHRK